MTAAAAKKLSLTQWVEKWESDPDMHCCDVCKSESTRYVQPSKRARYLLCGSCRSPKSRFPCNAVNCGHVECWESRRDLGVPQGPHPWPDDPEPPTPKRSKEKNMAKTKSKKSTTTKASKTGKRKGTKAAKKKLPKMKQCPTCEEEGVGPRSVEKNFYVFKKSSDNPRVSTYCKDHYRAHNKAWREAQ